MKHKLFLFIVMGAIILDQLSKYLVSTNLLFGQSIIIIPNFFSITHVANSGASFSILEGKRLFFILITIIALYIFITSYLKTAKFISSKVIYGFLVGGTLGNFIDRLLNGKVIDFLDFSFANYNFPVFNLADVFICLGAFCWIILTLYEDYKK